MSTVCIPCNEAKTRKITGGIFQLGCHGCTVRRIATAPRVVREAAYAAIADPTDREEFKRQVNAEYARVQGLK